MTSTTKSIALLITFLALAGCGNKGPLIRAADAPATTPAAAEAAPVSEPASEPANEATSDPDAATGTPADRR